MQTDGGSMPNRRLISTLATALDVRPIIDSRLGFEAETWSRAEPSPLIAEAGRLQRLSKQQREQCSRCRRNVLRGHIPRASDTSTAPRSDV
jgi:hypothetical protein